MFGVVDPALAALAAAPNSSAAGAAPAAAVTRGGAPGGAGVPSDKGTLEVPPLVCHDDALPQARIQHNLDGEFGSFTVDG